MQRASSTSKLRNSKSLNEKKKCSLVPRSVSFGLKIQESSHEGQFPVLGPTLRTTCFLYPRFGFMRMILATRHSLFSFFWGNFELFALLQSAKFLFHCFTVSPVSPVSRETWNSETALLDFRVKQWNSETAIVKKSETVKLFHQNCLYFLKHGKMVLEHIVGANLLFFQPIFQKNREFIKQIKLYSRTNSISIYWYRLNLFVLAHN